MGYRIVRSKMAKTLAILENPLLARHVPETVSYSPHNLIEMLARHSRVYVKPDRGRQGHQVFCIFTSSPGLYQVHYKFDLSPPAGIESAISFAERLSDGNAFIIQQGIELLRVDEAPVDFRIVVQKPYRQWIVSGIIAKIAAKGCAVTNFSQGGTLRDLPEVLIRNGFDSGRIVKTEARLSLLGGQCARTLNARYPGLRELGVDMGLDLNNKPWIFEINTRPQFPKGNPTIHRYHQIILRNTHN